MPGDERVLPVTRIVAVVILPFLVVAATLLYALPTRTGELFAWQIDPPMSAYLLASAYVGGIWFFAGVAVERRWHRVRHGFPAVAVFAGALLAATLLHLDRFSDNVSFFAWLVLYATTPFVIAALAILQWRRDSGRPDHPDVLIPRPARFALAAVGAAAFVFGAALFIAPDVAVAGWAWDLTPLTARVTGAVMSLTGVVNAALLWDSRWSAFRILFHAQLVSLTAIAVSLAVRSGDLAFERPVTVVFLALVAGALIGYGALTAWCEGQLRRARGQIAAF